MRTSSLKVLAIIGFISCQRVHADVPYVGQCTAKFFQSLKPKITEDSEALETLAKKVRFRNDLELDEAEMEFVPQPFQTNLNFVKDPGQRSELERLTAAGLARRAMELRDHLTSEEWRQLVTLWAAYLDSTANVMRHWNANEFCGPGQQTKSIAVDAGFTMLLFVYAYDRGGGAVYLDGSSAGSMFLSPFALTADVVMLIPSSLMKWNNRYLPWSHNGRLRRSAKAFARFARAVLSDESKYLSAVSQDLGTGAGPS